MLKEGNKQNTDPLSPLLAEIGANKGALNPDAYKGPAEDGAATAGD